MTLVGLGVMTVLDLFGYLVVAWLVLQIFAAWARRWGQSTVYATPA